MVRNLDVRPAVGEGDGAVLKLLPPAAGDGFFVANGVAQRSSRAAVVESPSGVDVSPDDVSAGLWCPVDLTALKVAVAPPVGRGFFI